MRARKNRLWLLAVLVVVGAAAWMAAGTPSASAGTVVTATDPSMELSLLDAGIASTGFNCNQVCPTPPGPCTKENCFVIDHACGCHSCAGELKCVRN